MSDILTGFYVVRGQLKMSKRVLKQGILGMIPKSLVVASNPTLPKMEAFAQNAHAKSRHFGRNQQYQVWRADEDTENGTRGVTLMVTFRNGEKNRSWNYDSLKHTENLKVDTSMKSEDYNTLMSIFTNQNQGV